MVACALLLLLTGALVQTQNGAFTLSQTSDARWRTRAACQTLYDFCLYQIEHQRDWGKGGFSTPESVDPARRDNTGQAELSSRIQVKEVDGSVFRGTLSEHASSFEVEVVNALTSLNGATSRDGLRVGGEQVRLRITAWDGPLGGRSARASQRVDCLLRLAPLYDGSILSRGDVSIATNQVLFSSKDPFRNEIRAEGQVTLPGLTEGRTRFVMHNEEVITKNARLSRMTYDRNGILWSGQDIAQESGQVSGDPDRMAQALAGTGGRLVDRSSHRADIYDLKPENIPQPAFQPERDIRVPPGEFRFTKAMADVRYRVKVRVNGRETTQEQTRRESIDVVEYYDPPNSLRPQKVLRAATASDSDEEVIGTAVDYGFDLEDVPVVVGNRFALDASYQDSVLTRGADGNEVRVPELGFRQVDSGGAPVIIDLTRQTVTVQPQTRVRPTSRPEGSALPASAFELTFKEGPGGVPRDPTFELGNGGNDVVIEAEGNISIGAGYTRGLGTIISKEGSVTLNPRSQELKWVKKSINDVPVWVLEREMSVESNDQYAGLVVYAGKDVKINNINNSDWSFQGFVYARENFELQLNGKNATFFGSVVAGNSPDQGGSFQIQGGDRATFIYDPTYLKELTRQLPRNWTRVEALVWSESQG